MNIDAPMLGDFFNPIISISEGSVLANSDKHRVDLVPKGSTCVMNVKSNTNGQIIEIDNVRYKVIHPPPPIVELLVDGKLYDGISMINKKSSVVVRVRPDNDFKAGFPADARYVVSSIDVLAQMSLGNPTKVTGVSGGGKDAVKGIPVDIAQALASTPPGTKVYFKIDRIYRINFESKSIEENLPADYLVIGVMVK